METDNTNEPIKTFYGPSIVEILNQQIEQHRKFWVGVFEDGVFITRKEIYEQSEPDAGRSIHTSDD